MLTNQQVTSTSPMSPSTRPSWEALEQDLELAPGDSDARCVVTHQSLLSLLACRVH